MKKETSLFEWLVFTILIAIILIPVSYIIKKYEITPVQAGLLGVVCGMLFMRIAHAIVKKYEKDRARKKDIRSTQQLQDNSNPK